MKWSELTQTQRYLVIGGASLLVVALLVTAFLIGRGVGDEPIAETEPTATVEPTGTLEPTATIAPTVTPEPESESAPAPAPAPAPDQQPADDRVFGQLKGVRDESGGAWQSLWIDIDTAQYLEGDAALAWLTSIGNAEYYSPDYWYANQSGAAITSYQLPASGSGTNVDITMYTWPNVPAPGFYGSSMTKQVVGLGEFYDAIYMDEDSSQLLNRYYWFTVKNDFVIAIEEQPRDPYYEP